MATYAPPYPPYPYAQQQQQQRRNYPSAQNWAPGPPPFPGAPPIPPGISVNPQAWNAGVWQYNPAYKQGNNAQQQQQHVPWIPSHHWMPQQRSQGPQSNSSQQPAQPSQASNQAASYNPYKRQSREGSAEYYSNKLSDNPLGLFNMIPATVDEYYRRGHETPWIWKPRDLEEDPSDPTSGGGTQKQESFTEKIELQPTFSSKIIRTPEHYRNSNSTSNDSPSSPNTTPSRTSRSSVDSQLSSRMSQMSIGSTSSASSNSLSRHSSLPLSSSSSFSSLYSASPTKPEFGPASAAPVLTDQFSDEPDSILSPLVLSNTPLPPPPKSLRSVRNNHPNPLLATQSLDTIPEAPASRFGTGSSTPQQQAGGVNGSGHKSPPLHHANSVPNPPKTQLSYPPQVPSFPPPQPLPYKTRDREKERETERENQRERDHRERERDREKLGTKYTTYVDPHYSTSTPSPRNSIPSSSSRPSPSSDPSSTHASPIRPSSIHVTPPSATYPTSPPSSAGMMSSPPRGPLPNPVRHSPPIRPGSSSTLSNPLPPPPRLVQRSPILPVQRTPPPVYREKLRKGFWNRRGDHLTPDGYIVYAPKDKAYPDELRTYPEPNEGYQDHNRIFAAWTERPELPQSLPRRGEPPECPYDAFVVYEYKV